MVGPDQPANIVPIPYVPLQADVQGLWNAFCQIGVGAVITYALAIGAMVLLALTMKDLYELFKGNRSKDYSQEQQDATKVQAGKHLIGAIVVGQSPFLLDQLGFGLISCVDPVNMFTGGAAGSSAIIAPVVPVVPVSIITALPF